MAKYSIVFKKSVAKDLSKIPKKDVKRIVSTIQSLAIDPRPATSKKLTAQEKYRIRQGIYRILYSIEDTRLVVTVVKVGNRQDVFKKNAPKLKGPDKGQCSVIEAQPHRS